MGPAQLAYPRLNVGGQLPGVVMRAMRPIGQPGQTVLAVATQPGVHRLASYPVTFGDFDNRNTAGDDLHDGAITLLHDAQLHEHQPRLPPRNTSRAKQTRGRQCYPSFGASVSPINRSQT
jgi:hypothetical protein